MAKAARRKAATTEQVIIGRYVDIDDPRVYQAKLPWRAPGHVRVLGLDLGNSCGAAVTDIFPKSVGLSPPLYLAQWNLGINRHDSGMISLMRLQAFMAAASPDLVAFEVPMFTPSRQGGAKGLHLLHAAMRSHDRIAAWVTAAELFCNATQIPYVGYTSTELKRYATGSGVAKKQDMIAAAEKRFGVQLSELAKEKEDAVSNMADAAWALALACQQFTNVEFKFFAQARELKDDESGAAPGASDPGRRNITAVAGAERDSGPGVG